MYNSNSNDMVNNKSTQSSNAVTDTDTNIEQLTQTADNIVDNANSGTTTTPLNIKGNFNTNVDTTYNQQSDIVHNDNELNDKLVSINIDDSDNTQQYPISINITRGTIDIHSNTEQCIQQNNCSSKNNQHIDNNKQDINVSHHTTINQRARNKLLAVMRFNLAAVKANRIKQALQQLSNTNVNSDNSIEQSNTAESCA